MFGIFISALLFVYASSICVVLRLRTLSSSNNLNCKYRKKSIQVIQAERASKKAYRQHPCQPKVPVHFSDVYWCLPILIENRKHVQHMAKR